jgi:hypothetical protein
MDAGDCDAGTVGIKRQACLPIFLYEWLDDRIIDQLPLHSDSQPVSQSRLCPKGA